MAYDADVQPYQPRGANKIEEPNFPEPYSWQPKAGDPPPKEMTALEKADDVMGGIGKGVRDAIVAAPGMLSGSAIKSGEWIGDRLRTGWMNLPETFIGTGRDPAGRIDTKGLSTEEIGKRVRDEREATAKGRGDNSEWSNVGPVPLPTSEYFLKRAKEAGVPDYEPKSNWGKAPQKVAGLGATIAMGPGSWAQKGMMTLDGAGLGWLGGNVTEDMDPGPISKFFGLTPDETKKSGEVIGTGLGMASGARSMRGFTDKEGMADRGLAGATAQDADYFRQNPRQAPLMTPEEIQRARELGVDVPNWSTMGPNQRNLIRDSAKTRGQIAQVEDMNRQINAAQVDDIVTGQRPVTPVIKWMEDTFGGKLDAGEMWLQLRDHMKDVNGQNYKDLYALPHAQEVWSPEIARLYNSPRMKAIIEKAQVLAAEDGSPINAPVWREPQGSVRTFNAGTMAFDEAPAIPGGWVVPEGGAPPNIAFHNFVRRALNDAIDGEVVSNGYKHNESTKSLTRVRDAITGEAEKIVPEWGQVRSKAADLFGKEDALDFGPEMWKKSDTFSNAELRSAFRGMSQDEQAMAQYSLGTVLRDELNKNLAGTIKKIGVNRDKLSEVLGQDYIENLMLEGKAAMQRAKAQGVDVSPYVPSIREKAMNIAKMAATPTAWTAPALAQMGEGMLGAQPWAHMIAPAVHGVSGLAPYTIAPLLTRSLVRNAIARPMIRGARDNIIRHYANPEAPLRLPEPARLRGPAMPQHPDESFLDIRPERAAGGELGPRPRGKMNVDSAANALVKQVEQARMALSGETQSILAEPDSNVHRALSVAKHALG